MSNQPLKIGFDADLTIRNAAAIKAALVERLETARTVKLELNPAAAVDLSFVQLLSAARLFARTSGGELTLVEPASPMLRDLLSRAGFVEDAPIEDLRFWFHSENAQ